MKVGMVLPMAFSMNAGYVGPWGHIYHIAYIKIIYEYSMRNMNIDIA